jgi:hypothetical protein
MENIKKIIILISLITMSAVIISIIDLNKKVNSLQNNLIENKEKNQTEVNISAETPNLTVQDEENLEE